jgi:hypothetical protein
MVEDRGLAEEKALNMTPFLPLSPNLPPKWSATRTGSRYTRRSGWRVHSNQPDKDATATADGYSHSYWTNGSGYALIYLNGPPPGVRITVTVGGATCTTSD